MLKDMPFTVSPSAADYIAELMRLGASKPQLAGGVPTLSFALGMTEHGPDGRIVQARDRGFFHVGWDDPHQASDWDRFRVAGFELAVPPGTLEMLRGQNLEVELCEVKGGTSRYLVARKY